MNTGDPAASRVASTAAAPILPGIFFYPLLQVAFSQPSRSSGCSTFQDSRKVWRAASNSGISSMQSANGMGIVDAVVTSTSLMVFFFEATDPTFAHEAPLMHDWSQAMMIMVGRAGVFSALASSPVRYTLKTRGRLLLRALARGRGTYWPHCASLCDTHCHSCRQGPAGV